MMLLFGEAQKNNLFSHDIFARYLISTGAMMDNSPHAKQFQTYLYFCFNCNDEHSSILSSPGNVEFIKIKSKL